MKSSFYKFISQSNKRTGLISRLPGCEFPIFLDGDEVSDWNDIKLSLDLGEYCHYHLGPNATNIVSKELKELLESYIEKDWVRFLPVTIVSEEYGDREYYIVLFKKIYDVIDWDNSICYVDDDGSRSPIKVRLDEVKVQGLHVINSQPVVFDLMVSDDVRLAINRKKLNTGFTFRNIYSTLDVIDVEIIPWLIEVGRSSADEEDMFDVILEKSACGYKVLLYRLIEGVDRVYYDQKAIDGMKLDNLNQEFVESQFDRRLKLTAKRNPVLRRMKIVRL